ncbi:MAG TPA: hypothetical protein VH724_13130 [Candidatus Angelobacter sp.]|nr:hypothetical protein [Candidatus Angelobacter sp.]
MRTFATLFAATVLTLSSYGQDGRSKGSSAQAELHISVIVAPVVFPPRDHRHGDRDRDRGKDSVTYNLPSEEDRLSITQEVKPMLVDVNGKGAERQPVQLTTVVAR